MLLSWITRKRNRTSRLGVRGSDCRGGDRMVWGTRSCTSRSLETRRLQPFEFVALDVLETLDSNLKRRSKEKGCKTRIEIPYWTKTRG